MKEKKGIRFDFIDRFRGLIVILMLLDHSSYYLNSVWKTMDPLNPLFPDTPQFLLRYAGYLCAPGFLMMAGAMVWWAYRRRVQKGVSPGQAKWHLIQRGLFLILVQITWVNSSWSGFQYFKPGHLGIISTIGMSIILLTLIIDRNWKFRLATAIILLLIHPVLLHIHYDTNITWQRVIMQTFVDAGSFNKYPFIPWFAMGILGSVMAKGWLESWKDHPKKTGMSIMIGVAALVVAVLIRAADGFGNIFPHDGTASISFFSGQKYPPSLFMNVWFFGLVNIGVGLFVWLTDRFPLLMQIFAIPGKVSLFFYGMHIAILGIVVKRFGFFYREGGVTETLIGVAVMMLVMLPLCIWFYKVKRRSNNYIIKMI